MGETLTYATHLRADAVDLHRKQFDALTAPGTWFSGAQRLAIAQEAREAGVAAGIFPRVDAPPLSEPLDPTSAAANVVRRLATAPATMERRHFEEALQEISCEQYVELVGVVSRLMNLDIVRVGVDLSLLPLPAAKPGKPTGQRPHAVEEGAWAPTVPSGTAGGEDAIEAYGSAAEMPFIVRALSLVPAENRQHVELGHVQYLPLNRFHDLQFQHHEGLSRPQVELLAGRVSAINECFY